MKSLLFIVLFISLTINSSYSQPLLQNDTSFKPFSENLVKTIDSTFHLAKDVDFELRFWTLVSKSMERQLFILSLKNKKWTARLFKKTIYQKDTLTEIPVAQNNLDKLWMNLNKYKLLTLPKQYDLRDKNGNEIMDAIHDGNSYIFELITKEHKRSFWYHCPKIFSEDYKYIKEYKNVVKIITLVYEHCLIKLYIC